MTADELRDVLDKHAKWLRNEVGGARADLTDANLKGAYLMGAYLTDANLKGAYLMGAYLTDANLKGADLTRANLRSARDIPDELAARLLACPESGAFEGWKKCVRGVLVRVRIPAEARRSSATTRKCRAEFVDVLEVVGAEVGIAQYDNKTEYRAGQRVTCHEWHEDRWQECAGGIHFFITRAEAKAY